ncbi:hypothetical protein [Candidatus Nanohalobium constans]|uniref:Uncharacterized protein n=1 Tax=Candidatus Nanohalobium constans TaxID=2565781 RepID=A0A5Q0UGU6_9ARCH|nr:hypothetical protein [Candidatus Nanohalobium constans]QGA80591.1 hypothetical protein LC1Nh_0702 [Candidatus Nanohalobium constans]
MKDEDERQRIIHAESGRNAMLVAVLLSSVFLLHRLYTTGEIDSGLMYSFLGVLTAYVVSVLYYRRKGVKNSLSLSSLR